VWCNRWLSLGGRLTLVKAVLEATLVFWHSLAYIPIGIRKKIQKRSFKFLWNGKKEKDAPPLVNWKCISKPKAIGNCGLKNIKISPIGNS
jgi:hypothetical protein